MLVCFMLIKVTGILLGEAMGAKLGQALRDQLLKEIEAKLHEVTGR